MKFVTLNKITADRRRDAYNDTDEPGEGAAVQSQPVSVNIAAIRCFYPRRDDRPGCRITFTDGGGFAVTEPFDELSRAIAHELARTLDS